MTEVIPMLASVGSNGGKADRPEVLLDHGPFEALVGAQTLAATALGSD